MLERWHFFVAVEIHLLAVVVKILIKVRSAVAIDDLPPNQIFVYSHYSFLYRGIGSMAFHFWNVFLLL